MTPTVEMEVQAGLRAHRAGRLADAIGAYDRALARAPDRPQTWHLRGVAHLQLSRPDLALDDLRHAIRLVPGDTGILLHLLTCLEQLTRFHDAAAVARKLLLLKPDAGSALDILSQHGRNRSVSAARALAVSPTDPVAWAHAALAAAPRDPQAAAELMRRSVVLSPADALALLDLADLTRMGARPDAAEILCNWALSIRPANPRALAERAAARIDLAQNAAALADTRNALVQDPALALAWSNRGEARYQSRAYDTALSDAQRARTCVPADPRILANLGAYHLALGDLDQGWPLFRNRPAGRNRKATALPEWTGQSQARLLVRAEQGLGDELLFSTLWSDLDVLVRQRRLASVTVETDPRLTSLARRALPDITWRDRFRPYDDTDPSAPEGGWTHWCLAGDLPALLRPTVDRFARSTAGLRADPAQIDAWRDWLHTVSRGRPTSGFCWRSGNRLGHRNKHYPDIAACAAVLGLPDRLFVVLQYDECSQEVQEAQLGPGAEMILPPGLDLRDDQAGVAALIGALDSVISADTAVLALAGSLGTAPTVGFGYHAGWVSLGQSRSPWFSNVSTVYHGPDQDWSRTMVDVAQRVVGLGL